MTEETSIDSKALFSEMQGMAQTVILEWFANFLRIRLATQSRAQRALTIAILQDGLDEALNQHATQTRPSPLSREDALKAALFKEAFAGLSTKLMATMGRGLTAEEEASMS